MTPHSGGSDTADLQTRFERGFMEQTVDSFPFVLAEALGMPVAVMEATMSQREFLQWRAFYTYRHAQQELAMKEAQSNARQ